MGSTGWWAFVGICFVVSLSGAVFKPGDWYARLRKPRWRPPNWLFGPAWAVLYIMIATAGFYVWQAEGVGLALGVYAVQLLFNAAWSGLFFGLRRPDIGFYGLVALWLSILGCIVVFAPVSATAMWLMVPYLAWVSFAGVLNWTLWQMNGPRPA
jgi:tryptophan-rich sensory protein